LSDEKRLFSLAAALAKSPATVQEWCGKTLAALRRCESMASRPDLKSANSLFRMMV
jgi:hypothetical protein